MERSNCQILIERIWIFLGRPSVTNSLLPKALSKVHGQITRVCLRGGGVGRGVFITFFFAHFIRQNDSGMCLTYDLYVQRHAGNQEKFSNYGRVPGWPRFNITSVNTLIYASQRE